MYPLIPAIFPSSRSFSMKILIYASIATRLLLIGNPYSDFFYQRLAALAIMTLNGSHQFGKPMRVNQAYASQREDTSGLSKLIWTYVGNQREDTLGLLM
uniref:Uncharacterized protein n=2 Tax=Helianthus annuus TaxID=4232 RepID=A0A251SS15_HELAN